MANDAYADDANDAYGDEVAMPSFRNVHIDGEGNTTEGVLINCHTALQAKLEDLGTTLGDLQNKNNRKISVITEESHCEPFAILSWCVRP